jgi:hypothetical protein
VSPALRLSLAAASALALAACSSITPIAVSTSPATPVTMTRAQALAVAKTVQRFEGTAWTTSYTGQLRAGPCRGTYTGGASTDEMALELHCDDGRYGAGRALRQGGQFAGGRVRFNDGTVATVEPTGPALAYKVVPEPHPFDYSWPSRQIAAGKRPL